MLVKKCILSLAMTSVRPVNRLLGFGIRGMTPSDVVLLPYWMCICPRSMLSIWFSGNLHDNHSTHSVSGIERAVAGNNVVGARKNARSVHVEILKVERFGMREGRKGERPEARRPPMIMPRGVDLFLYTRKHVPGFSSSCPLVFVFLVPRCPKMAVQTFTLFYERARLFYLLDLYSIYRVHDEAMKFAGAEIQLDSASSLPEFVP